MDTKAEQFNQSISKMFRLLFVLSVVLAVTYGLPGRIVGGRDAKIEEVPWQGSLRVKKSSGAYSHNCGCSIYNENTLITAAHCLSGYKAEQMGVVVGATSLDDDVEVKKIKKILYHSSYSSWSIDSDVGLIILAEPLEFSEKVQPIGLVSSNPEAGSDAVISGWGSTREGGSVSKILQHVIVKIVDRNSCKQSYASSNPITENMICAGVDKGGKDACQGDSGGPLVVDNKLAGIVSWGLGCARATHPGVYSSVANLRSWIEENTKQ